MGSINQFMCCMQLGGLLCGQSRCSKAQADSWLMRRLLPVAPAGQAGHVAWRSGHRAFTLRHEATCCAGGVPHVLCAAQASCAVTGVACASAPDSLRPWRRCAQEPRADVPRFTLPDGRAVALSMEGAALGEALVDPSALGLDLPPVAEAAFSAAMSHHDSAQRKVGAPRHAARTASACTVWAWGLRQHRQSSLMHFWRQRRPAHGNAPGRPPPQIYERVHHY